MRTARPSVLSRLVPWRLLAALALGALGAETLRAGVVLHPGEPLGCTRRELGWIYRRLFFGRNEPRAPFYEAVPESDSELLFGPFAFSTFVREERLPAGGIRYEATTRVNYSGGGSRWGRDFDLEAFRIHWERAVWNKRRGSTLDGIHRNTELRSTYSILKRLAAARSEEKRALLARAIFHLEFRAPSSGEVPRGYGLLQAGDADAILDHFQALKTQPGKFFPVLEKSGRGREVLALFADLVPSTEQLLLDRNAFPDFSRGPPVGRFVRVFMQRENQPIEMILASAKLSRKTPGGVPVPSVVLKLPEALTTIPGKGTPIHLLATAIQMRRLGIPAGGLGSATVDDMINLRTAFEAVIDPALAGIQADQVLGVPGAPPIPALERALARTHTYRYISEVLGQTGHEVTGISVPRTRWRRLGGIREKHEREIRLDGYATLAYEQIIQKFCPEDPSACGDLLVPFHTVIRFNLRASEAPPARTSP